MHYNLHPEKQKAINNMGLGLVDELIVTPVVKPVVKATQEGYLKHKRVLDLGEIAGPLTKIRSDFNDRVVEKFMEFQDSNMGFGFAGFQKIHDIASQFLKDSILQSKIHEAFVVDKVFDWCIGFKRKECQLTLCEYVLSAAEAAISEYTIYFPVLSLETNKDFTIGVVTMKYLTENYIKYLSQRVKEENRNRYLESLKIHTGQLMACCTLHAEKSKAISLASSQVTLSLDVIRLVSPTVEIPELKLYFDVDFRNTHQQKSDTLIQEYRAPEEITLNVKVNPKPFVVDQRMWDGMVASGVAEAHAFILKTLDSKTELESLVLSAIKGFSKAIATHDLHERIVQVFTVLESLLLLDNSVPIIDSVCKYLPKLVSKEIDQRKDIVECVKKLYAVRSSMVHHARRREFKIEDLIMVQICARALIFQMMSQAKNKKTKREVLQEIDDIINAA